VYQLDFLMILEDPTAGLYVRLRQLRMQSTGRVLAMRVLRVKVACDAKEASRHVRTVAAASLAQSSWPFIPAVELEKASRSARETWQKSVHLVTALVSLAHVEFSFKLEFGARKIVKERLHT
jgi:hypothetical protein